jgi:hypothetical protein
MTNIIFAIQILFISHTSCMSAGTDLERGLLGWKMGKQDQRQGQGQGQTTQPDANSNVDKIPEVKVPDDQGQGQIQDSRPTSNGEEETQHDPFSFACLEGRLPG